MSPDRPLSSENTAVIDRRYSALSALRFGAGDARRSARLLFWSVAFRARRVLPGPLVQIEAQVHDAILELRFHPRRDLLKDTHHGMIVRQDIRREANDAVLPGNAGQIFGEERADAMPLKIVVHRHRHLGLVRRAITGVTPD